MLPVSLLMRPRFDLTAELPIGTSTATEPAMCRGGFWRRTLSCESGDGHIRLSASPRVGGCNNEIGELINGPAALNSETVLELLEGGLDNGALALLEATNACSIAFCTPGVVWIGRGKMVAGLSVAAVSSSVGS